jgi:hypothetical protein
MLSFNEMIECEKEYTHNKNQMLIEKYTAFVDYLKKVIKIAFKDNEEQIVSYLKESNDQSLLLDWCPHGIHYDGFYINVLDDKTLGVSFLKAHDSYYDPMLELDHIDNDKLLSFFDKEYQEFLNLFIPCYNLSDFNNPNKYNINEEDSIVYIIARKFNKVLHKHFKEHFDSLNITDEDTFIESKFSLKFTNEQRRELDKEVFDEYYSFSEKCDKIIKKFDGSVKDLK